MPSPQHLPSRALRNSRVGLVLTRSFFRAAEAGCLSPCEGPPQIRSAPAASLPLLAAAGAITSLIEQQDGPP